jgi:porin
LPIEWKSGTIFRAGLSTMKLSTQCSRCLAIVAAVVCWLPIAAGADEFDTATGAIDVTSESFDETCHDELALPATAQFGGCCCERTKLTGDWCGRRTCWAENGLTADLDHTYFYFGIASGGLEQHSKFGGHGDYLFNFDFGKLDVHPGLFLKVRAEHRFGETISRDTGALLPATISPDLPIPFSEDLYVTNFLFTQALSESFAVFAGKMDVLDGDANAFAHGRGKTQFSNLAFVGNPIALRAVNLYSTLGAGFVVMRDLQPLFTFSVLNASDTTQTIGFEDLFEKGATLLGELRLPTNFFGLPGHQLFGAVWTSRDIVSVGQDPWVILPNVPLARQSGAWSAYWNFDQYLATYSDNPTLGWGVFGRWGVGDERSNPLAWFLSFGIGGNSPILGRETDTFGIGYYYGASSDDIGPFVERLFGPIGDGQGVELFYNYQVTPWFHLTPDLQVIDPARSNVDNSLVLGLRGKVDF